MAYINGKNAKLFMTTENGAASVVLSGSTAAAGASSSTTGVATSTVGVGALGLVTDSSTCVGHMLKFVEGIDYNVDFDDDSYKPFGVDMEQKVPIRKNWSITITRKTENSMFRKLFSAARFGAAASNSLHDGTAQFDSTVGYRFYLNNGSDCIVLMHGIMDTGGFGERIDSSRLNVETLKFSGNYWIPAAAAVDYTATCAL
jgi:hypothetical protein